MSNEKLITRGIRKGDLYGNLLVKSSLLAQGTEKLVDMRKALGSKKLMGCGLPKIETDGSHTSSSIYVGKYLVDSIE